MTPTNFYWAVSLHLQADIIFTSAQISEDMMEDLVVDYQTFEGIRVHSICGYVEYLFTADVIGDLKKGDDYQEKNCRQMIFNDL